MKTRTTRTTRRAAVGAALASAWIAAAGAQTPPPTLRIVESNAIRIEALPGVSYQLQSTASIETPVSWTDVGAPRLTNQPGPIDWSPSPTEKTAYFRVVAEGEPNGPAITQPQAEALALETVIQPESLDSLALGLRWPSLLRAGDAIRPLAQASEGGLQEWIVERDSYFFVVDRAPAQKLGHPFDWVLVAADTGELSVKPSFYPPVVGETAPFNTLAQRWEAEHRFYPPSFDGSQPPLAAFLQLEIPPLDPGFDGGLASRSRRPRAARLLAEAPPDSSTASSTVDCSQTPGRKVAVVVASGADDEIQNDARDMGNLLQSLGFTVTSFSSATDSVTAVQSGIQQAAQGLGPCDKFFLYVSSHTELVDENDDGKPDHTPIRLDYGLGHDTFTKWSIFPRHPASASLTAGLQNIKAGRVNIMLDTCFAEAMAVLIRRYNVTPPPGVEWNIFAASSEFKTSAGATELDLWLDYDNDEVNSQYTERVLERMNAANVDSNGDGQTSIDEIEAAFLEAQFAAEDALADAQMPHFDRFVGPLPTAVTDTFTVPSTSTHAVSVAANDTAVPGVRYVLVDPPPLHSDLFSWDEATGIMMITGLTGTEEVVFTYKAVVDAYETQAVLGRVRFDPSLNINLAPSPDPNNAAREIVQVPCLILGNLHYPIYQFRLTNNPQDSCKDPHWHSFGNVFAIDVRDNNGRPDPNPPGCGFGKVSEVPQSLLVVDLDAWEQFKIDHIPPL